MVRVRLRPRREEGKGMEKANAGARAKAESESGAAAGSPEVPPQRPWPSPPPRPTSSGPASARTLLRGIPSSELLSLAEWEESDRGPRFIIKLHRTRYPGATVAWPDVTMYGNICPPFYDTHLIFVQHGAPEKAFFPSLSFNHVQKKRKHKLNIPDWNSASARGLNSAMQGLIVSKCNCLSLHFA